MAHELFPVILEKMRSSPYKEYVMHLSSLNNEDKVRAVRDIIDYIEGLLPNTKIRCKHNIRNDNVYLCLYRDSLFSKKDLVTPSIEKDITSHIENKIIQFSTKKIVDVPLLNLC